MNINITFKFQSIFGFYPIMLTIIGMHYRDEQLGRARVLSRREKGWLSRKNQLGKDYKEMGGGGVLSIMDKLGDEWAVEEGILVNW